MLKKFSPYQPELSSDALFVTIYIAIGRCYHVVRRDHCVVKLLPAVTQYWPLSVKRGLRNTDCGLGIKQGQVIGS